MSRRCRCQWGYAINAATDSDSRQSPQEEGTILCPFTRPGATTRRSRRSLSNPNHHSSQNRSHLPRQVHQCRHENVYVSVCLTIPSFFLVRRLIHDATGPSQSWLVCLGTNYDTIHEMPKNKNRVTILLGKICLLFRPSTTPVAPLQRSNNILPPQSEDFLLIYRRWRFGECFIVVPIQLSDTWASVQRLTIIPKMNGWIVKKGRFIFTAPNKTQHTTHNQTHRRERDVPTYLGTYIGKKQEAWD